MKTFETRDDAQSIVRRLERRARKSEPARSYRATYFPMEGHHLVSEWICGSFHKFIDEQDLENR